MKCLVCGKEMKALTNTHLKKHDMTPKEYEEKFGVKTVYEGWSVKEKNPFYGKSHIEGKSHAKSAEYREAARQRREGKQCHEYLKSTTPEEFLRKASLRMQGENNPGWIGGVNRRGYTIDFLSTIRHLVYERDEHECMLCGSSNGVSAHHIDYDKKNNSYFNLITLCNSCHIRTNFNREIWGAYLSFLLMSTYGNPEPSWLNGYESKPEGAETTLIRNPTNNSEQERPTSYSRMMR